MRRFLPIRIHSICYGYGWWWGSKFYFFSPLYVIAMHWERRNATYARNGKEISHGRIKSWLRYKEQFE